MFEIKVTVELPGIPEAVNNLANALHSAGITLTPAVVPDTDKAPATIGDVLPMAQVPKATPQEETPVAPVSPPAVEPVPVAPVKKYTFDEISNAGVELCDRIPGMTGQLVSLLTTKYGVESIADLSEDRFGELAMDLKALGAKLG